MSLQGGTTSPFPPSPPCLQVRLRRRKMASWSRTKGQDGSGMRVTSSHDSATSFWKRGPAVSPNGDSVSRLCVCVCVCVCV